MDCPACLTPMDAVGYGPVTFHACRGCGGLWFGPGELGRLLMADGATVNAVEDLHEQAGSSPAVSVFTCPQCRESLDRFHYQYSSPVIIDGCPQCGGVFLQDQELAEIVKWRGRDTSEEDKDAQVAEALSAADARMVEAIRRSHSSKRAARTLSMRWGLDGGLFKWSTPDVFAGDDDLPAPPQLRAD